MNYLNGHIELAIISDGGLDEFNNPLPATVTWTDPIRCHIQTVTHRNDGAVIDGIFTNSSYKIWFGTYTLSETILKLFKDWNGQGVERIRLSHDKSDRGDWQVQNLSFKNTMGRVEIIIGNRINRQV